MEDSLDGSILAAGGHLRLEDDAKGSIADDLALCVGDFLGLTGQSILDLLADDLCRTNEVELVDVNVAIDDR